LNHDEEREDLLLWHVLGRRLPLWMPGSRPQSSLTPQLSRNSKVPTRASGHRGAALIIDVPAIRAGKNPRSLPSRWGAVESVESVESLESV
jgi:hypothetical protein